MLPLPKLFCCAVACGSIRPTLTSCSGCGKENPRRTNALTMVNCVVTPAIPRARTSTANIQNDFSLKRMRRPTRTSWLKVSSIIKRNWIGVGDDENVLLGAQRDHWIHPRGAASRNETRRGSNDGEQTRDKEVDRRIERIDLEQDVAKRRGGDDAEEQRDAPHT